MHTKLLFVFVLFVVFLSSCTEKQYFKPSKMYSVSGNSYGGTITDLSRDGATLKSKYYIGKDGINKSINIGKKFRFLSENDQYVLASNASGILNVIDKNTNKSVRAVSLHTPIVSASIQNGLIAYVLNNNTFGLYQVSDNRKLVESRSERTFAIDTRAASPMFIDNLVIMPMLDGKLVVVDTANSDNTKVVYISSHKAFNNVIYLGRLADTMVAATPKKVITLGDTGKQEFTANISEVTVDNGSIYLFTKEGEVIRLNTALQIMSRKKFTFAHFSTATAFGGKVFGLDQKGALIVLSSDLSHHKIYDIGSVNTPVFITGTKLYKDSKIIELSHLGYE